MNLKTISLSRALLLIGFLLQTEFVHSSQYEYFTNSSGASVINEICYKTSGGNAYVTYSGLRYYYWYYGGTKYGPVFDGYVGGYLGDSSDVIIPSSVTISSSTYNVTSIGDNAFEEEDFTSVNLPNGIVTIGKEAFNYCENLTSINFPNCLKDIGSSAFLGCRALSSVVLPSGVTNINTRAFYGCSSLSVLSLPNTLTSIEESVFSGCSSLASLTIPNSVTSIGNSAFSGCSSLTSLSLPSSVINIGTGAFHGCNGLKSIMVASGNSKYDSRNGCNAIIVTNTNELLYGCMNSVIPNSITRIGNFAFYGCNGLTSLSIPNSVTSIGEYAFAGCSGLSDVIIPSSVMSIDSYAFRDCTGLTSITIPMGVKNINSYTFYNCTSLASVNIPSSVTTINSSAFENCSSLTTLSIPTGVISIGYDAFQGCSGLKSVIIPPSVTGIGSIAFYGCDSLTSVYMNCFQPLSIGSGTFSNRSNATLYVPMGTKEAYEAANYWKEFKEIIEVGGIVTPLDISACPGGLGTTMNIEMKNAEDIIGFQFDLQLPDGVSLTKGSNGKYIANLTSRKVDHMLSVNKVGENTYRFISVSMNNEPFEGTEGTLLNMTLKVDDSVAIGNYDIKVLNAELTTSNMKLVNSMDETSVLTVKNADPGDANGDMTVSVTDVGCTINYILEQVPSVFIFDAADMNGDMNVSVTDVSMIINLILNESAPSRLFLASRTSEDMLSPNISLQPTTNGYQMMLENKERFVGFQFDVELADGATIEDLQLANAHESDHLLTYRKLANGKWRVVCYSPTNSTFAAKGSVLLNILAAGGVIVDNVRLTTLGLHELRPAALVGKPTGIVSVEQDIKMSMQGETLYITSDRDATLRLLSIDGKVSRTLNVHRGQNNFNGLSKGVYLINNKKIINK